MRVAVLDDWQRVARKSADWSILTRRKIEISFFSGPLAPEEKAATALADYEILVAMRERMAFPKSLIARLPNLKMISLTGRRSPTLDLDACSRRGILVCSTGGEVSGAATAELALGLMIAAMRQLPPADGSVRAGTFQTNIGAGSVLEGGLWA